jgi:mono/diheme cytochrome c family protein
MKLRMQTRVAMAVAALPLLTAPVRAEDHDDISRGHQVALHICAACHAVERNQTRSPYAAAPPFDQVANAPAMTKLALRVALQSSHRVMPNIRLTEAQRADVIAYLMTLKRERPHGD